MFSRLNLLLQQSMTISSCRKVSQNFGKNFKRHLRNIFLIGILGFGTLHGYRRYQRHRWFNEMLDSEKTSSTKPRIIVLGTGWGAISLLKHIDIHKYEVICVSPRNYFLMTPLLPSVSVGTVETRTVIESIRSLIGIDVIMPLHRVSTVRRQDTREKSTGPNTP